MAQNEALGVIGGSGLYEIEELTDVEEVSVDTPFGAPSAAYLTGRIGEQRMVFLPRHGRGHRHAPHEINYRANLWGMKQLGVTRLLAISAVGSMRVEIEPGDFVIVDQFIDRTTGRDSTYFEQGIVGHVGFADPVCGELARAAAAAAREVGVKVHEGGTYVCINGPQFSTRAESNLYRSWGVDVIGMTNATEAKVAREAQICFSTIALATDYDCWHEGADDVGVEGVLAIIAQNVDNARQLVAQVARSLPAADPGCACRNALTGAILSAPEGITAEARERLALLLGEDR